MLKSRQLFMVWAGLILSLLVSEVVRAAAEFSDEPVDEIIHPVWFKQSFLDLKEDIADAKAAGKTGIIVFFGQPHCAYCNALVTNDFGDADIASYTQQHFDVIALNIYGSREVVGVDGEAASEHDFAIKYKAELTPTLDFYNTENKLVYRLRGYYPPEKFKLALQYVAGKHYLDQRFRDYLAESKTSVHVSSLNKNTPQLFLSPPYKLDRSREIADKPLMVLFEKGDCKTCKQLHDETLTQPVIQKLVTQFDAVQLDMWSDTKVVIPSGETQTAVEWAENLALFYAPTIVFFDEAGSEIYRIDSLVKLRRLRGILRYILSGDYVEEPNYESWKVQQKDME